MLRLFLTFSFYFSCSDLMGMRVNMSLPVSPSSSPLRQCKQYNRSCLPSPTHPTFSAGVLAYGPGNYLYPSRPSNLPDRSLDITELRSPSPYQWSRRWAMRIFSLQKQFFSLLFGFCGRNCIQVQSIVTCPSVAEIILDGWTVGLIFLCFFFPVKVHDNEMWGGSRCKLYN